MADLVKIRKEIIDSLKDKSSEALALVEKELDMLEVTEGLNSINNLESFYSIWQKYKDKVGHKNDQNSWTAYYLGITSVKPNGEFLSKRRAFARAGFPDIDSDFDYFKRDKVYDYLINKYGREYVGNIGTYGGLKLKSVVRRLGKALDIANAFHKGDKENTAENEAKVTEIAKSLPKPMGAFIKVKDENGKEQVIKTVEDAYKYCQDFRAYMDKYPDIRKYAKNIEGLCSNFGIHAAGIVLSDIPLRQIAPLRSSNKGLATQFPCEDLDSIGLIKFDILAISTLTVIQRIVDMVKENYGIDIDIKNLPINDEKTLKLYASGKLTGIFQCENHGMQETIKDIEPTCFNDIMAAIALYRPGPMISIPEYVQRKKGLKEVDYFHPSIEKYVKPFLQKTYGVLVYQEQVMQICNNLAGFSISDGYVMIKGIGKKKQHLIDKFEKQFIAGCVKNGVPSNIAKEYWAKFIVPFSGYGFNSAHSCCYAYLSYMTAYLKANFPEEFFIAYLNVENERKKHTKVKKLEKDLENFNIKLLPRRINDCDYYYKINKKADFSNGVLKTEISPSIMCKGMGLETAKEIADNRPYDNLRDLVFKTNSKIVTQEVMTCFVEAGFYDVEYRELNQSQQKGKKITKEKFGEMLAEKFASLRKDQKKLGRDGIGPETIL